MLFTLLQSAAAAVADSLGSINPLTDESLTDISTIMDAVKTPAQNIIELLLRFGINLLVCWILVRFFYYRKSKRKDYYFTFIIFSSAMLMLLYMMGNVEIGVGLTLGLFAIFGVIRYRTETVPIREMTYLFVIIAIAAMNGLAPLYKIVNAGTSEAAYALTFDSVGLMLLSNLLIVILVWVLETEKALTQTATKMVVYDRIELITPDKREELKADLQKRLGFKIDNVEVGHVDFLKDSAFLKVYYTLPKGQTSTIENITRTKDFE